MTNTPTISEVLFAAVCQTYIYNKNAYTPKGKLGVAITGLKSVIIYGQKQKLISACKIEPHTAFSITAPTFLTYYDDLQQCWGLMFTSEKDLETFQLNITLVKLTFSNTSIKEQGNFVQSDSKIVAETDTLNVSYDAFVVKDEKLGPQFDSEDLLKCTINSATQTRQWLKLLAGSLESGIYFIAIPSSQADDHMPPDRDILFRVHVKQILAVSPAPSPAVTPEVESNDTSSVESFPTFKSSENSSPQKDDILSRMARMGAHPALPTMRSPEQEHPSPAKSEPFKQKIRTFSSVSGEHPSVAPREVRAPSMPREPPTVVSRDVRSSSLSRESRDVRRTSCEPPILSHGEAGQLLPHVSNRQNAFSNFVPVTQQMFIPNEIKENLELSKNVDKSVSLIESSLKDIAAKLDLLSQHSVIFNKTVSNHPSVDTQLLMFNVQRVVAENEQLKAEVKSKSSTIEERSAKITELLNTNQQLLNLKNEAVEMTQNQFLANSQNSTEKIKKLEEETEDLKNKLEILKLSTSNRQYEIDAKENQLKYLKVQIEQLYSENKSLQSNLFEARSELSALHLSSINKNNGNDKILEEEIIKLKEKVQNYFLEKLEISHSLDDLQLKERENSLKYKKEIRTLKVLLEEKEENQSTSVNGNKIISEEISQLQYMLVSEKAKIQHTEAILEGERETFSRLIGHEKEERSVMEAEFKETTNTLEQKINSLINSTSNGIKSRKSTQNKNVGKSKELVKTKVKLILNNVFKMFREFISPSETYDGSFVLQMLMDILKDVTLNLLQQSDGESSSDDDDDNEDESRNEAKAETSTIKNHPESSVNSDSGGTATSPQDNLHHDSSEPDADNIQIVDDSPPGEKSHVVNVPCDGVGNTSPSTSHIEPVNHVATSVQNEQIQSDVITDNHTGHLSPATVRSTRAEHSRAEYTDPASGGQGSPNIVVHEELEVVLDHPPDLLRDHPPEVVRDHPAEVMPPNASSDEFEAREVEDLWMQPPSVEPPPFAAAFEPNLQHTTVNVEDIAHLSPEVSAIYYIV